MAVTAVGLTVVLLRSFATMDASWTALCGMMGTVIA